MDDGDKSLGWFMVAVVTLVVLIVCAVALHFTLTNRWAMENGYSQRTLQGQSGVYWVKDDSESK